MEKSCVLKTFCKDFKNINKKDQLCSKLTSSEDKKTLTNQVKYYYNQIQEQEQKKLITRKERLKELLKDEEKKYSKETIVTKLSNGEKQTSVQKRYADMMKKKEIERQKFAEEKKELLFRKNCSELNVARRKKIEKIIIEENKALVKDNARWKKEKEREDKMYMEMWLKDQEAKTKRAEKEIIRQKEAELKFKNYLTDCKQPKPITELDEGPITEEQIRREQDHLVELEKEAEHTRKLLQQEKVKRDLDACLKAQIEQRSKEEQKDITSGVHFLEQVIAKQEDHNVKREKKKTELKMQSDYFKYITDLAKREAEYEKEVEKLLQEDNNKMWDRKEQERKAERDLKKNLKEDIKWDLRERIQRKVKQREEDKILEKEYTAQLLKEIAAHKEEVMKEQQVMREKNLKYQQELLDMIEQKKERKQNEKIHKKEEHEKFRKAEEEYEKKIQEILANPLVDFLHPKRTFKGTN